MVFIFQKRRKLFQQVSAQRVQDNSCWDVFTFFFLNFIYAFIFGRAVLPCTCGKRVRLFAVASHCGNFSSCRVRALGRVGTAVAAHGLSCSGACVIFEKQGMNLCAPHRRVILNHWTASEVPKNVFMHASLHQRARISER